MKQDRRASIRIPSDPFERASFLSTIQADAAWSGLPLMVQGSAARGRFGDLRLSGGSHGVFRGELELLWNASDEDADPLELAGSASDLVSLLHLKFALVRRGDRYDTFWTASRQTLVSPNRSGWADTPPPVRLPPHHQRLAPLAPLADDPAAPQFPTLLDV